jgi:hypothetical protein
VLYQDVEQVRIANENIHKAKLVPDFGAPAGKPGKSKKPKNVK